MLEKVNSYHSLVNHFETKRHYSFNWNLEFMDQELQKDYHDELNTLMVRRREELEHLRAAGVNPYPHGFERNASAKEILDTFKDEQPQWIVAVHP